MFTLRFSNQDSNNIILSREMVFGKYLRLLIRKYLPNAEISEGQNGFEYTDIKYFKNERGCLGSRLSCRYSDKKLSIYLVVGSMQLNMKHLESRDIYGSLEGVLEYYKEGKYLPLKNIEILLVKIYNGILKQVNDKLIYGDKYILNIKNCWKDVLGSFSEEERLLLKGKPVQMKLKFD